MLELAGRCRQQLVVDFDSLLEMDLPPAVPLVSVGSWQLEMRLMLAEDCKICSKKHRLPTFIRVHVERMCLPQQMSSLKFAGQNVQSAAVPKNCSPGSDF